VAFQTKAEKWIAVAQQLMGDRSKGVRCAFCEAADLKVVDVPWSAAMAQRWITCPHCREATALRIEMGQAKT
jgi:hypothetical protein